MWNVVAIFGWKIKTKCIHRFDDSTNDDPGEIITFHLVGWIALGCRKNQKRFDPFMADDESGPTNEEKSRKEQDCIRRCVKVLDQIEKPTVCVVVCFIL